MKKHIIFLTLAALSIAACKKGDKHAEYYSVIEPEDTSISAPLWQVSYEGTEARPDWQEPDPSKYESWAILFIQLEDILKPVVQPDDRMAVFIGDELRGLAAPAVHVGEESSGNKGEFILKIYGNEAENNLQCKLRYYSESLHQLFTYDIPTPLNLGGDIYGLDEPFIPPFSLGAASYPVVMTLSVACLPLEDSNIKPAKGDIIAAFVDNECRGTGVIGDELWFSPVRFTVFGRKTGETVTIKYYHATTGRIITFVPTATTAAGEQSITIKM